MHKPMCPCTVPPARSKVEGPLHDGAYICNACGDLLIVDGDGNVIRRDRTQHSVGGRTAFGKALADALKS